MPYYELFCLASGKLDRSQLKELLKKTCRAFMDNGGTVTRIVPLGADGNGPRKIAYRIRLNQVSYETGFYATICAFASPSALNEVRRQLRIDERMLRHVVMRRRVTDAVLPIIDVNEPPPSRHPVNKDDPDYAMRKFLQEYQRDFPEGLTSPEVKTSEDSPSEGDLDNDLSSSQESSVRDILKKLKATSPADRQQTDPGLSWLSKLTKPDPPRDP